MPLFRLKSQDPRTLLSLGKPPTAMFRKDTRSSHLHDERDDHWPSLQGFVKIAPERFTHLLLKF
jgi:hypothetical protein